VYLAVAIGDVELAVGAGVDVAKVGVTVGEAGISDGVGVIAWLVSCAMASAVRMTWSLVSVGVGRLEPDEQPATIAAKTRTNVDSHCFMREPPCLPAGGPSHPGPSEYTAGNRKGRQPAHGTNRAGTWYNGPLICIHQLEYDGDMRSRPPGTSQTRVPPVAASTAAGKAAPSTPARDKSELEVAGERLEAARRRLLSAAIAFCDGSISVGQLRAVRELMREQEVRVVQLQGSNPAPFVQTSQATPSLEPSDADPLPQDDLGDEVDAAASSGDLDSDLQHMLSLLDRKLQQLEQDFQQGRVNATQYRAIRRHYVEQREVAMRLRQSYPDSDRWRVVLEEGKTSFLMQLNEAVCHGIALYDLGTRQRIYLQGNLPPAAEEAMALLRTFGPSAGGAPAGRMMATQAEDGSALLLIPGQNTAALVVFSQQPPAWQVRALREVHRNFETANKGALARGDTRSLVFPDMTRFIRS
jgi:hypothetical protein